MNRYLGRDPDPADRASAQRIAVFRNDPAQSRSAMAAQSGLVAPQSVVLPASPPHMRAVLDIVIIILDLYVWLLIASAILSWLVAFNVVNTRNQFVSAVAEFLYRITEPVLRPIRNVMPNLGGLDISPIIVILIIMFIQRVIAYYIYPNVI
jgi:YggT family protein